MAIWVCVVALVPSLAYLPPRGRTWSTALSASRSAEPVAMSYEDDPAAKAARQARRAAILEASQRAAQRMQAQQSAPPPVAVPSDEARVVSNVPAPVEEAPIVPERRRVDPRAPRTAPPPRNEAIDDIRERFARAPQGYTPYFNTGDAYLADLTADSTERHWSLSEDGKTKALDTISRQFGVRPGQGSSPPYATEPVVRPPPVATAEPPVAAAPPPVEKKPPPPPVEAVEPSASTEDSLSDSERSTISRAIAGLVQYVQVVQATGALPSADVCAKLKDQIQAVRDIIVEDAKRVPPPEASAPPPVVAAAPPPAVPFPPEAPVVDVVAPQPPASATSDVAISALDASGVAERVAAISPAFAAYAAKIEEFACDGAFLSSLAPAELDETLVDIGVGDRLQRRRIIFALGLQRT